MLSAIDDHEARIEVVSGYGNTLDSAMKRVIDEYMIPRFREGDYSGGIRRAATVIYCLSTKPARAAISKP